MELAQFHGPHVSGVEGLPQLQRRDGVLLKTHNVLHQVIRVLRFSCFELNSQVVSFYFALFCHDIQYNM